MEAARLPQLDIGEQHVLPQTLFRRWISSMKRIVFHAAGRGRLAGGGDDAPRSGHITLHARSEALGADSIGAGDDLGEVVFPVPGGPKG